HQAGDELLQGGRNVGAEGPERRGEAFLVPEELVDYAAGRRGWFAGEEVKEGAAEAVEVGAEVHAAGITGLLRGDVVQSADDDALLGENGSLLDAARLAPNQAEVQHLQGGPLEILQPAFCVARRGPRRDQEVLGLDVAVDEAQRVRVVQPL